MAIAEDIGLAQLAALPVPGPGLGEHIRRAVAAAQTALAQRKRSLFSRL